MWWGNLSYVARICLRKQKSTCSMTCTVMVDITLSKHHLIIISLKKNKHLSIATLNVSNSDHLYNSQQVNAFTFCEPAWSRPPACSLSRVCQGGKPKHFLSLTKSCPPLSRPCCSHINTCMHIQLTNNYILAHLHVQAVLKVTILWPYLEFLPSISSKLWMRLMARLYISAEMYGSPGCGDSV